MSKSITLDTISKNATNNKNAQNEMIQKLVDCSRVEMLSLNQFIKNTKYDLDDYAYNKLYHSIKDDIPIYLDNELIKWMGYQGTLFEQKRAILRLFKKYNI